MKSAPLFPRLLGDVGGTNARFGWQPHANAELQHIQTLPCSLHADLAAVIEAYLAQQHLPRPAAACIGIATAITGDMIKMTNLHWSFSIQALQKRLGLEQLLFINDFTALALALPSLPEQTKIRIGGLATTPFSAPMGLIGAGTGLGVSGLLPNGRKGWMPISGEGGHITLAASTQEEFQVIELLQRRYGHVSAERILSGHGLLELHTALDLLHGRPPLPELTSAEISRLALQSGDKPCLATLEMFTGFLGSVAGDLALTLGARGGIYIGGGIVPRWLGWFEQSSFRKRFDNKGRFSTYLQDIPVWVIQAGESPALQGAAQALDNACS